MIMGIGLMEGNGRGQFLFSPNVGGEKKLLQQLLRIVPNFDAIITWRGRDFDLPFIIARSLRFGLPIEPVARALHLDLALIAERNLRLGRKDLASVCRYFGIKKKVELSGTDMPSLYLRALEGDGTAARKIKVHCMDDLSALRAVFERLRPLVALDYPTL